MGSDDALLRLAEEVETLRLDKKFDRITDALNTYYQPNGDSSIGPLRQLVELRSDASGLDAAVQKALQKIGTKEVVPLMVKLLDSQNANAQLGACWFLAYYMQRAGSDGHPNRKSDGIHPFASEENKRYWPVQGSEIPTVVYVSYWKTWWAQNREKLGFPGP